MLFRSSPVGLALHAVACIAFAAMTVTPACAEIQLPDDAAPCVQWAANEVNIALSEAHMVPATAVVRVSIGIGGPELPREITLAEQGFSLTFVNGVASIEAGGAVGAMYGLEELAEQIRNLDGTLGDSWKKITTLLTKTTQRPSLEVRADNMFLHTRGTMRPAPPEGYPLLVNDLAMWHGYIDMLARDRYNLLDLHGAYDLESTSFPNLYPMLVHVPEYSAVGEEAVQKRNLDSLKSIISYAASRGIRVALMNYSANNGRSGEYKSEPSVTGVPAEKLADYTAKAVALLIRELPDLYMLGFRVGESTQPASFFQDAYLKGVQDAGSVDLRLYTRSWQTTKDQLEPIAQTARNGFDIEIKFNGEQLGLPYQSMQGAQYGSYSYQSYLDVPTDYHILWQIRANGTHRFWAWENTEFIRRTVEACTLGNARGFTLEPHVAYFSVDPAQYYRSPADTAVNGYVWQKHWMWYYAWGRLGYDPALAETKLVHQFQRHFGPAGASIYRAMQRASEIVPLVYAYRMVGPDQRDYSPETETGNFDTKKKRARQDLLQFAKNKPEDSRSFAGIDEYIEERIAGVADGRYGPFDVARRLTDASAETRAMVAAVHSAGMSDTQCGEWRLLRTDLLAASWLGQYHAARIKGMAHLEFALKTGQESEYHAALDELKDSREAWRELGAVADAHYKPLANPLRRQIDFQWSSQNLPLATLDETVGTFWEKHESQKPNLPLEPDFRTADSGAAARGLEIEEEHSAGKVRIRCYRNKENHGVQSANLWWKPLPSELTWRSEPMAREQDKHGLQHWAAEISLDGHGLMYLIEFTGPDGSAFNAPDESRETPWRIVPPSGRKKN